MTWGYNMIETGDISNEDVTTLLKENFDEMVVYKNQKNALFKGLALPSFLRDWVLKRFESDEGVIDNEVVSDFINEYVPTLDEWQKLKAAIVKDGQKVKLVAKICIDVSIKTQDAYFSLPDYGLNQNETIIEDMVWDMYKDSLLSQGRETWGVVELGYLPSEVSRDKNGKIRLMSFNSFCPYKIDLDYYKDARNSFTTEQWIDLLIGAIDYNPESMSLNEKCAMLRRLLPFVENNLNIVELAPKGTGKTYMFAQLSRFGKLVSGSIVTRAAMFYNVSRGTKGFVVGKDYVAIDEAKLVNFGRENEMRGIMQDYMERGKCDCNGCEIRSNAGIIFIGNINQSRMDENKNMFSELPTLFAESALLDRIHGFIKGWDIPRMKSDMKMVGWALNCEYFTSIMHSLRSDASYRRIVDEIVKYDPKADERHSEAVKRLTSAFLKLIFPNVRVKEDVDIDEFKKYCLDPAVLMREIIYKQLVILDEKEYKDKVLSQFSAEL